MEVKMILCLHFTTFIKIYLNILLFFKEVKNYLFLRHYAFKNLHAKPQLTEENVKKYHNSSQLSQDKM
jgi:hypothetical protein